MTGARVPATGQVVNTHGPINGGTTPRVLFVNRVGSDGWLQARNRDSALIPLCKYTRLRVVESRSGRTSFKVLDGSAQGQTLSLSDANAAEYLGPKAPASTPATVTITYGKYVTGWVSEARNGEQLDQQMATLEVAGLSVQVAMNSVWGSGFTPLPAGTYSVLLPDAPHKKEMTRFYRNVEPSLQFDQVWFPIKHQDNSRYVHVGNLSDGCATVLDLKRWADVHEALISRRTSDGRGVAELVVKGTPERSK